MDDTQRSWMAAAACRDVDMFPPSDADQTNLARHQCGDCPVAEPCLAHALTNRIDHGVWGGTTEQQRRQLRRRAQRQLAGATA